MGKADVEPAKAMLGASAGGAVRLFGGPGPLVVAEGIETALSLSSGLLRATAQVWAALSTSGIRGLRLPAQPARLTIAPDGDTPGRDAAHAFAERADALGWRVSLLPAPTEITLRDMMHDAPTRALRDNKTARAAIALLEKNGWLVKSEPGTVIRGAARKEAWHIVGALGDVV